MVRTSAVKVSGAFLAGLVAALGSALLYVHVQDRETAPVAKLEQTPLPAPAQAPAPDPIAQSPPAVGEAPPQPVSQVSAPAPVVKASPKHVKKAFPLRPRIVSATDPPPPVQVVENTPTSNIPIYPPITAPQPTGEQASKPPADETAPIPAPAEPEPNQVTLSAGTMLSIRLGETLSTAHNYTGDTFRGTLDRPIVRNGFIIADKGSKVLGRIVDATPAGRMRGVSNLSLTLTEINTTDGQHIRVATNAVEKRGTTSTGEDAAKIAGGAALGAIIGALGGGGKGAAIGAGAGGAAGTGVVLAMRGKPAILPSESLLNFQLDNPVTITEQLHR